MSFGFGVGDVMSISKLAFKVYTAWKDAPEEYRNISDEVKSLHIVIESAEQHLESTTLSDDKRQKGQEVLRGCQNLLEDLDTLIGKYNDLAPASTSTNTSTSTTQVLQKVKLSTGLVLGTEDIATLRARLTSNTTLLSSFIQSCDSHKLDAMQARLDNILGLRRSESLVSLAGSINTKKAYRKLVKDHFAIGVTADMINKKEKEIKSLFGPQQADAGSPMDDSTSGNQGHKLPQVGHSSDAEASPISTASGNQSQLPDVGSSSGADAPPIPRISQLKSWFFGQARPPIDFLVGPRMLTAAEAGDTQLLISTLEYVRDINFKGGSSKVTALHKAAGKGHRDVVQLLLSKGASVNVKDVANDTPLHEAAWNGHTNIVGLLLTEGASIEARGSFKETPLHDAVRRGHTSTVELLLMKGASVEVKGHENNTPLHFAARSGYTSIVELLLMKCASIEALNNSSNTPLDLAISRGHTDTIKLLEKKAAELGIPGNI